MSLFSFSNRTINDVVQLNAYLKANLGTQFKYVNYVATSQKVIISSDLGDYVSTSELQTHLSVLLDTYSSANGNGNPLPQKKGGIQSASTLRVNTVSSYSTPDISLLKDLNMSGHAVTQVSSPTAGTDAANKNYVDAISAGKGLQKLSTGPTFAVNLHESLETDGSNNIRLSSSALGTGLTGGSGSVVSVIPSQTQITQVGVLNSLSVSGNLTASSGINVAGKKITNLLAPVDPTDAANRAYVESTVHFAAGNALSSVGTLLSVNVDNFSLETFNNNLRIAPNFIGTGLSGGGTASLSVNPNQPQIVSVGTLTGLIVSGVVSISNTSDTTGVGSGAFQVSGGFSVSKSGRIAGNLSVGGTLNVNGNAITNVLSPVNGPDATNKTYVDSVITTPGAGIVKSGTTVSANVDSISLEISPSNNIRIASGALGTGLTGGSGAVISVVANQSQVTQVGTLVSLQVSGVTAISDITNVSGDNTGSLQTLGGIYVAKDALISGKITVNGIGSFAGNASFTSTVAILSTLDSGSLSSGSLVVSGGASFGKSVNIGGNLNLNYGRVNNLATPINNFDGANKGYVDSLVVTAGNGLTKVGTVISAVVDTVSIEIASGALRVASGVAGTGLSGGSGTPLSVNSALSHVTSLGMLSSLSVNGSITAYSGVNVNNRSVTNLAAPLAAGDATNKNYVDTTRPVPGRGLAAGVNTAFDVSVDTVSLEITGSNLVRIASGALGTGLTGGSGSVISVVPNQSQVITVGTLTNLSVASSGSVTFFNTSDAVSAATGPVVLSGGLSVAKSAYFGGSIFGTANFSILGNSTVLGNSVLSGLFTVNNTTESTAANTGSAVVLGGIGVGKNISVGGMLNLTSTDISLRGTSVTGARALRFVNTNAANVDMRIAVENSVTGSAYSSTVRLYNLGNGDVADRESLELIASPTGSHIRTAVSGTGSGRTLTIGRAFSIAADGSATTFLSTTDSTALGTGSVVISNGGGLSVSGQARFATDVSIGGALDMNGKRIVNLAAPVSPGDAVNRGFLEQVVQGLSVKKSVAVATTGNVVLNTVVPGSSIDGTTVSLNERILVKDQTNAVENGIYVVTANGAVRSDDFAVGNDARAAFVFVESGTVNAASGWVNSTPGASDIVGTNSLIFSQFSAAGQITAGNGMNKFGNTLDVNVDGTSLEIFNDILRVKTTAYGTGLTGGSGLAVSVNANLSHVTGLGTITSGIWRGTTVDVGFGGTGSTSFTAGHVLYGNGPNPISTSGAFTYDGSVLAVQNLQLTGNATNALAITGTGGATIGGSLSVTGASVFSGRVTVPTPTLAFDASTKGYVDSLVSTAGTGLSKSAGLVYSVNAQLPHVTQVGTLSGLVSAGQVSFTGTISSTGTDSGTVVVAGGIGVSAGVNIGGELVVGGQIKLPLSPSAAANATSKSYVDSLISTAGTGLLKIGNVFSVVADQSQITSVGTLTGLSVTGGVIVFDTTDSTTNTTGAFVVTGGAGFGKNVNVGGNITTTGVLRINGNREYFGTQIYTGTVSGTGSQGFNVFTIRNAVASSAETRLSVGNDLATTQYASKMLLYTFGTHESSSGNWEALSLYADLTGGHIDFQTGGTGQARPITISGNAVYRTDGTLELLSTTTSTSTTTGSFVVRGGVGIAGTVNVGGGLDVTGTSNLRGVVTVPTPTASDHAVTKAYVDSASYLTAGTGLTRTGATLSVNAAQSQITSVGTLTGLTVSGAVSITDTTASIDTNTGALVVSGGLAVKGTMRVQSSLYISGTAYFMGETRVSAPVNATNPTTKTYVDSAAYLTAGTGLTRTGATFTVNSSLTHVTSVGTLTGISSSGVVSITDTTDATGSVNTGSLRVAGGMSTGASLFVGSTLAVTGAVTIGADLTIPLTPTLPAHAASKSYVDSGSYITAGTGLSRTGATLSVNNALTNVTSVGTLTGLTSSGNVLITSTFGSTSSSTGSFVTTGGVGIGKDIFTGGSATLGGNLTLAGYILYGNKVWMASFTTGGYNTLRVRNSEETFVDTRFNIGNDVATGNYSSRFRLFSYGVFEKPNWEGLTIESDVTGANIHFSQSGNGVLRNITIADNTVFQPDGKVIFNNTSASTSVTTGTAVLAGGLGVSGTVNATSLRVYNTCTVPTPVSATDAVTKAYTDAISYVVAGTGIVKTGSTLSVNASQPGITTIGPLTALSVLGTATFSGTVTVPPPVNPTDAATRAYVDATVQGLNVKQSVRVATNYNKVLSTDIVAGQLIDGVTLVAGDRVLVKSQTNGIENGIYIVSSSGAPTRSADFASGSSAKGNFVFVEIGTLNANSGWTVTNTSGNDVVGTHAINFVQFSGAGQIDAGDALIKTGNRLDVLCDNMSLQINNDVLRIGSGALGTGLSGGSGTPISINSAQPTITSLGTLTGLTVSGASVFNSTVTVQTPVNATDAATKGYIDATITTAGTGLTKTGTVYSVNNSLPNVTSIGTLTSLISSGAVLISNTTDSIGVVSGGYPSLYVAGGQTVEKSLYVNGVANFSSSVKFPANIALYSNAGSTNGAFGVALRLRLNDSVNKDIGFSLANIATTGSYTSGFALYCYNALETSANTERLEFSARETGAYITWFTSGTGMKRSLTVYDNTVFNTDGTVQIINTTAATSATTGAFKVAGGLGVNGSAYIGGNFVVTGTAAFTAAVTVPVTPVSTTDAVSKIYVDSNLATAGSGLTKAGTALSVNAAQPSVTSLGTLTGLTSSGAVSITDTTDGLSATAGSIITAGGVSMSKALYVGGNARIVGARVDYGSGNLLYTHAALGTVDGLPGVSYRIRANDSINTEARLSLANTGVVGAYGSRMLLYSYNSFESSPDTERLEIGSTSTGGYLRTVATGTGVTRSITVQNNTIFDSTGIVRFTTTTASTSVSTGSIVISGGLGISGTLNASDANFGGPVTAGTRLTVTSTTASTSTTTGSFIVAGGVGIAGSLNIGGSLSVTGASTFTGTVTIPITPVNTTDAASKNYVDTNIRTAGTGLTLTGTVLSVNSTQSQILSVGTLTSLTVSGATYCTNTTDSTSVGTGSVIFSGGQSIAKNLYVGGTANLLGTAVNYGNNISSGTLVHTVETRPTVSFRFRLNDNVNTDVRLSLSNMATPGAYQSRLALFTLNSLETSTNNECMELMSSSTGGVIRWVANGTGVARPITVAGGTVFNPDGTVSITNATTSTTTTSGALTVTGGVGINGAVNIGGSLSVVGPALVGTPTATGHATTKLYVDTAGYLTAGTGLTKTGATFSVNAAQTGVTSVGTLTGLSISGTTFITNTTDSTSVTTGALVVSGGVGISANVNIGGALSITGTATVSTPTLAGHAATKAYVDAAGYITAGSGLTKTGATLTVNAAQTGVTSLGTLTALTVSGAAFLTNTTDSTSTTTGSLVVSGGVGIAGSIFVGGNATVSLPTLSGHATTKSYVDSASYLTAGTGLTKTGATFSVNTAQTGITSVGTLTALSISGATSITNTTDSTSNTTGALLVSGGVGISASVNIGGGLTVTGTALVATPTLAGHAATKGYVDANLATAGSGLTKSGTALSVNAAQPVITLVGTLTGLTVSGTTSLVNTTDSTSTTTGGVIVSGGVGVGGNIYLGGTPSLAGHAATKAYVDANLATAGSGLTKSGTVFSVNAAQLGVTSLGTLTGLTVSGTTSLTDTTASTSITTGALVVSGGVGATGALNVGGNSSIFGTLTVGAPVYYPNSIFTTTNTTAGVNSFRVRNSDTVNTLTTLSVGNTGTTTGVTSRLVLFTLNTTETSANTERLMFDATPTGGQIYWGTAGTGVMRSLTVYNNTVFNIDGTVSFTNTTDSTTTTTGSLTIAGGLGVAKNITAFSGTIGNAAITPFQTTAAWINLPTTGASGIGTGGAGANCWIGYASSAGNWFTNAAAGDVCYRNASGKLLWGNTSGTAGMSLSGDNLGIGTITPGAKLDVIGTARVSGVVTLTDATDSATLGTGSLVLSGGISIAKIVSSPEVRYQGTTSGYVALRSPATVTSYTLTLPTTPPATGVSNYLVSNSAGTLSFTTAASPVASVYDNTTGVSNVRIYNVTVTTTNGVATCYPTADGTATGAALFTNILTVQANAVVNTASAIAVGLCGVKNISADNRTVTVNVVTGVITANNTAGMQFAPNGTSVKVTIVGIM